MAIEINAQFNQFVQFAQPRAQTQRSVIARVDAQQINNAPLEGREINAARGDRVAPLWRSQRNQDANNATRALFKESVIAMFGSENAIPTNVREAMKLHDYGKGKPLTVRRIMTVKGEVDNAVAKLKKDSDELRANARSLTFNNGVDINQLNAKVEALLNAAGGHVELVGLLKNSKILRDIIYDPVTSNLRTDEAIAKKVEAHRANVDELREATKGEPTAFKAGMFGLLAFGKKSVPKGIIKTIVALAKQTDISAIAKLKANSGTTAIHKAATQLTMALEKITAESRILTAFNGGARDESLAAKQLIGNLILSRLSPSALRNLQDVTASANTGKLFCAYGSFLYPQNLLPEGTTYEVEDEVSKVSRMFTDSLSMFKAVADDLIGPRGGFAKEIMLDDDDPELQDLQDTMLPDMIKAAEESLKNKRMSIAGTFVSGNGQGSDMVRNLIVDNFTKGQVRLANVESTIGGRMNETTANMINWNIVTGCHQLATGEIKDSSFAKDLHRTTSITLGGKQMSKNLPEALDQIARFVTGDEKATYQGLQGVDRGKAHIIMSLISQENSKASFNGSIIALHPDANQMAFNICGEEDSDKQTFDVSFSQSGALIVKNTFERSIHAILPDGEAPTMEEMQIPMEGRSIKTGFTFTLGANAFKHYAGLDYSKYDNTEPKRIEEEGPRNMYGEIVKSLDPQFRINDISDKCQTTFALELN